MTMIDDKYAELGGPGGFLGPPVSPELQTPNGLGFYRHYQNNGSIYWKTSFPAAFEVHGLIRQRWADLGWETSPVGFPVTDERDVVGKPGRTNTFESGVISWTPATGAHEVHGAILGRWLALGREAGFGFPLTDELATPDGRGRYNHFETGSIYWTPQTGAVEIKGAMKDVWSAAGWEQGPLGYPTTSESVSPPGGITIQDFEHGYLCMQTNLAAFSRTVIQPPTVIALPVIMIGWEALGAPLPDGDRISVVLGPAKNPNSNVTLTLNAGPAVTWFKGVGLWSVSRGTIAEASTQDARKTSTVTLQAADIEKSDAFIVFEKAKLFGVHTGMYWLTPTRRLLGHDVTFTWTAD
jgi:uncharacterized protein with LGFP repeats